MASTSKEAGFTLTELLVTVAIVAILAAIAYPSYLDQVRKSRRAEGKGLLLETAQALEKCRALYGAYNSANCAVVANITGGSSLTSVEGFYLVSAPNPPNPNPDVAIFILQAVPQQPDPRCGTLTLDQAGDRRESGTSDVQDCW